MLRNQWKDLSPRLAAWCFIGAIACGQAAAQTTPELQAAPEPPEIPKQVQSGEVLEPDVTIVPGKKQTITEYRISGELRAIKVQPDNAPAYYLIDTDGNGSLDRRVDRFDPDLAIPQWVIFSW